MGNVTCRRYGGAGFALSDPVTQIRAERSTGITIEGVGSLDIAGQHDLKSALERLHMIDATLEANVVVEKVAPQHVGLGSKSSLILGALAATVLANGKSVSPNLLQTVSGRGGASGVGINSFFCGGFVTDGGHAHVQGANLVPSSARRPTDIPPVLCHISIPPQWNFHLLLPKGVRFSGQSELDFFAKNTPIPKAEILEAIGLSTTVSLRQLRPGI